MVKDDQRDSPNKSELISEQSISQIDALTDKGLYVDAIALAESLWGPIEQWQASSQIVIAIRLMYHLGGDRSSDALLLKSYRKQNNNSHFIERMLYYRLNRFGPILADEFSNKVEPILQTNGDKKAEYLAFRSILVRELKDFSQAEQYLQEAIAAKPDDNWIPSLKVRLLMDQEQDQAALDVARTLFEENPSVLNLRLVLMVVQKTENLKAAIELLKKHVESYQSCVLWLQLASMCATELDWDGCEYAVSHFTKLRRFKDKLDEQRLLAYRGQIELHKRNYEAALPILQQHRGGYWKKVCDNLAAAPADASTKVLDVPFYRQEHLTCAPTTMAAISNFWAKHFDSKSIAEQICFSGTPDTKERQWLRDNDFHFVEFDLKNKDVFTLIDLGIPFCLVTTHGFTSHLQAVIGYNQHVGSMYIMDPSYSGMQEMLIDGTIEDEAYHGPRCMAFVPNEKASLLAQFESEDIPVYSIWDKYVVAREINDTVEAKKQVEALKTAAPEHRLTAKAERDYALAMGDYATVLNFNERLLKQYPNETTLLNSEYLCLRDLGQRSEGLVRLEKHTNKHFDLDLCVTLFDQLCGSNEKTELQLVLLEKLKRFGSYQADIHHSIAHYYWGKGQRDKATQHYLYAYCLDETNNTFIENYFKACRYLGQENKAVTFIEQRFDKYADRSPAPAIALFRVFELQNEEHKGIAVLEQALQRHPRDVDLIKTFTSVLINHSQIELLELHNDTFRASLSPEDYAELQAEIAVKRGVYDEALNFYKGKFEQSPFITKSSENFFALLYRLQKIEELDTSLETLYKANSNNAYACDYLIQWHSDERLQRDVLIESIKARQTNGDLRRKLIDKHIRLGEKSQALSLAQETLALLPSEDINEAYLAKAFNLNGKFEQARVHAKAALLKSIDNDVAFNELFFACKDNQQKRESLRFVLEQISQQVVFGDCLWNYWFEANNVVEKDELASFIELLLEKHAHLWFTYAIAAFYHKQMGDLKTTISYLEQGIEKFPFTPRLHKELGHVFELLEQTEKAIGSYKTAMQLNPAWPEVTKLLVDLYEKQSANSEAIKVLENTLHHTPDDGILHGYTADFYLKQENNEKALYHLKKAVEFQSDYPWAWRELSNLGNALEQTSLAYDVAQNLVEKYPHISQMWCNLAAMCENRDEEHAHIRKAIAVNPMNQQAYVALVNYHIDAGDYQKALAVFSDTPWQDSLPFQLVSNKANLLAQIGQYENAVSTLKEVLYTQAGYGNLWQSYYDWLYKLGKKTPILEAANKQIELNKHDPSSLCYASEILLREGDKKDQVLAKEQLIKAFTLAPNDQYIVLTLADLYLDEKEFEEALRVLQDFEVFNKSSFGTARQIICLSALDRQDEAQSLFQNMLKQKDADYWCISKPFESFIKKNGLDEALGIFEQSFSNINEVQAYIWADTILSKKGVKHYKKILKRIEGEANKELHSGTIRAIFEAWNDNSTKPDYKVIDAYHESILQSSPVFEQVSMLLLNNQKFDKLISLFNAFGKPDELSMYCYYQARCAYQFLNQWDKASAVIEAGIQKQPDTAVHNMRLWYLYEIWRTGNIFDESELDVIDYHELVEVERYVYSTLKVAVLLGSDSLEACLERITPALRRCQEDNQEVSGNYLATSAQQLLRERLKARITTTGFFGSMMMKWKLSNRF